MKRKTVILTVVLFALIVVGMFIYTRLKTVELNDLRASLPLMVFSH